MSELVRFSVAMPEDLMDELDRYTARREEPLRGHS